MIIRTFLIWGGKMSVEFTSQEFWYIGIVVFLMLFIICLPIILPLLSGLWDKFYDCCSDIDRTFQNFSLITLWYEFLINLKIFYLTLFCTLIKSWLLLITNPIILIFFVLTIVFSWICPINKNIIILKFLPLLYLIILLIYTFISMKKLDEDCENKNKDINSLINKNIDALNEDDEKKNSNME